MEILRKLKNKSRTPCLSSMKTYLMRTRLRCVAAAYIAWCLAELASKNGAHVVDGAETRKLWDGMQRQVSRGQHLLCAFNPLAQNLSVNGTAQLFFKAILQGGAGHADMPDHVWNADALRCPFAGRRNGRTRCGQRTLPARVLRHKQWWKNRQRRIHQNVGQSILILNWEQIDIINNIDNSCRINCWWINGAFLKRHILIQSPILAAKVDKNI